MSILAIIQARASSTRLPNKVLLPLLDKPMLQHQIERVRRSTKIDTIVVATSTEISDDSIESLCKSINVPCYRGSLEDVLDRYYSAANNYSPEHVVRITGDCPVIDSEIIDQVVNQHLLSKADYTSNTIHPTYPDGLDVEVMKFNVLKEAWEKSELASEREHVTPYIKKKDNYVKINIENNKDLSHIRLTVDELVDYELVKFIYESIYLENNNFKLNDILILLENNLEKAKVNQGITRNEGYIKSLREDHVITKR